MKYLYLLPKRGYFAGNGCADTAGKSISLNMVSEPTTAKDDPKTPITYIRRRPGTLSARTAAQLNMRSQNMKELSAENAIKLLLKRGRTISNLRNHQKQFGQEIIAQTDIDEYEHKRMPVKEETRTQAAVRKPNAQRRTPKAKKA